VGILSMDGLLILACLGDLVSGGLGVQGRIENHFGQRDGKGDALTVALWSAINITFSAVCAVLLSG